MNEIWLSWGDVFQASFKELWWGFIQFTPKFLVAVVLFMVGWLLGNVVARALEQVFGSIFELSLERLGANTQFA